jgi:hypothetical protein
MASIVLPAHERAQSLQNITLVAWEASLVPSPCSQPWTGSSPTLPSSSPDTGQEGSSQL